MGRQFRKLLVAEKLVLAASVEQAVCGTEFLDRKIGLECLLSQFVYAFLKPITRASCRFVFRVQLIHEVGISN